MNSHLVILKKRYLDLVLSGRKTIELRLTRRRCPPFGRIEPADRLFLKASAGPVSGLATVAGVTQYENLTPEGIAEIKRLYHGQIGGDDAVWESMMDRTYGLLIALANVRRIDPIHIAKKDWRAWVVLEPGNDFGLLNAPTS